MQKRRVCVVGLGYVGLPLAHAFARAGHTTSGYDVSAKRIDALKKGIDATRELSEKELGGVTITFSTDPAIIGDAEVVIMALPTPVDENNKPDMTILLAATQTVGKHLKPGMIVCYESTVYPGVTEDLCGTLLAKESGLTCGKDFHLGYSPERINPGDKEHAIQKIVKIVAGQDGATLETLKDLYGSVVEAGIHTAPSIKVAEMAKAIENAQRDLNIAFMNEIALLCHRIGINTNDVLAAAGTKWNFLPFRPGLVGGHCIGVDPYYLVEKANQLGMHTHVITAGRSLNDSMSAYVATQICEALAAEPTKGARILVSGLTFKEDVPDQRNSKALEVVKILTDMGMKVDVMDDAIHPEELANMGLPIGSLEHDPYDAIVVLVAHRQTRATPTEQFIAATREGGLIYDLKSIMDAEKIRASGRTYLAL
jgi:UDP-N-acetyl-D-galactosamine dehydrogenase